MAAGVDHASHVRRLHIWIGAEEVRRSGDGPFAWRCGSERRLGNYGWASKNQAHEVSPSSQLGLESLEGPGWSKDNWWRQSALLQVARLSS